MRRTTKLAAVLSTAVLALSACGGGDSESDSGGDSGGGDAGSDIKVGVAYDVGGRGDQSFNDSAAAGLDQASDELGLDFQESEASDGESEADREERLRTFAEAGYTHIIGVGFAYSPSIAAVAPEYPEVSFAIIDDEAAVGDNIANLVFAEEQGSFLVGAAAALKSESGQIGFVGGVETPLIQKFQAGYEAGAEAVNEDIQVDVTYLTQPPDFSGFADPARGETAATGMYDDGADVVYHAAGGSGGGVFEAASQADALAIGVDSDQYETADPAVQDVILTSMLKNVNVAVYEWLTAAAEGDTPTGTTRYDLAADGVGYSTSGGQVDDIEDQLEDFKQQIVDGEIEVPTTP
ncbi:BMP family ABC transporter substrate-binding protein [uncultured Nocardioides sp.]|uniref:BMP family lipoprotein n=1 Tax=uncultured Nocardioides sp. TaxID=198441 RepID=UPI00261FAD13|nr:BMP family ABC transporter substrate-binding protein [uncultured Nocardioides sp.]